MKVEGIELGKAPAVPVDVLLIVRVLTLVQWAGELASKIGLEEAAILRGLADQLMRLVRIEVQADTLRVVDLR